MFLIIIPDMHIGSQFDGTLIRFYHIIDDFQNRGFARSVIPNQRNVFPPLDFKGQIRKQRLTWIGFCQIFHRNHIISAYNPRFQMQMNICIYLCGLLQTLNFIQHFFSAFRPFDGLFPIEGFQFCNHFLLMFNFLLLVIILF